MDERRRSWFRDPEEAAPPAVSPLARVLWTRRQELGLSRAEAARRADISAHYWWELERGEKQGSNSTLSRVAAAVRLKPHELMASADALAEEAAAAPEPPPTPQDEEGLARARELANRIGGILRASPPTEAEVALLIALGAARSRTVMNTARARRGSAGPSRPWDVEVAALVVRIPRGRWAGFGDVASALGRPGAAQAVAAAMLAHPGLKGGHRILRATGEIVPGWRDGEGGGPEQCAERLRREGVEVVGLRASPTARLGREELDEMVSGLHDGGSSGRPDPGAAGGR